MVGLSRTKDSTPLSSRKCTDRKTNAFLRILCENDPSDYVIIPCTSYLDTQTSWEFVKCVTESQMLCRQVARVTAWL